ncbi:MAG: hypothetical protein U0J70_11355 [Atopobiaceae bacterium]|nr:hypothetical protein [Atopobiaceae bacterium]
MSHGVSIAHAKRLATGRHVAHMATVTVGDDGRLHTELSIDIDEAGLRRGKSQDVRAVLYEMHDHDVRIPLATSDGRHAVAIPLTIHPGADDDVCTLRVDANLPRRRGEHVGIIVERVRDPRLPIAAAVAFVVIVVTAAWLLGAWGDPSARKGHYEGKTTEEIQADLDADVAWHSMEISVASRINVPEGQTRIEARIENVEANHCDQKVRIWETGHEDDVLFESGALAPGEYLQYVELAHPLDVGEHVLTVQFQGYEQQPALLSNEGVPLGHDTFGASCAAEVVLEVTPA